MASHALMAISSSGMIYWGYGEMIIEDPSSGSIVYSGFPVYGLGGLQALAVDSSDVAWLLYSTYKGTFNSEPSAFRLVTVDPATQVSTVVYTGNNVTFLDSPGISVGPLGDVWGFGNAYNCSNLNHCQHPQIFKYDVGTGEFSVMADLSSTYVAPTGNGKGGFVVDSGGIAWVLFYEGTLVKYGTSSGALTTVDLGLSSDARLSGLVSDSSGTLYFLDLADGAETMRSYYTASGAQGRLQTFSGGVAWFVCDGVTQDTVPTTSASLLTACPLNGVKWQAGLPDRIFLTTSDMEAYAKTTSAYSLCTSAVYDTICGVVKALPPYVCTMEVSDHFITYFGVAAANAEFLYVFMVFACGLLLDFLGSQRAKMKVANTEQKKDIEAVATAAQGVELTSPGSVDAGKMASRVSELEKRLKAEKAARAMEVSELRLEYSTKFSEVSELKLEYSTKFSELTKDISALKVMLAKQPLAQQGPSLSSGTGSVF